MHKNEKGQILLIVVLVMIVSLTVGLSVASRSITNLRTSTEEVSSQKALAAAEAGIEQSILSNASIASGEIYIGTTYSTTVTEVKGTSFLVKGGNTIAQDEGADIWLSDYSKDSAKLYLNPWNGNLTIYWGNSSDSCSNPALEIVIVSGTKISPKINRYAFDPCSSRASNNHFTPALSGGSVEGVNFSSSTPPISIASGLIAKIIPLYSSGQIGVVGDVALPSQGFITDSTGKSGNTVKKINAFQGYPQLSAQYFSYGLFSH
ncbi:MAG: hypothetical protein Q7R31_00710 [Candidatus Levybacteria bacterium]|nr:hypothetical protein [Candidatus Levybacteria bacterium]